MFPNSYSFNPGMVLDPVTMTPMLTGGGNITVNPLGVPMRPENKVWQKMFINNIPQECTNQLMQKLLNQFGIVKNYKRAVDNRARLMTFCHFELESGEEILRIRRLFKDIKILDKTLDLKISPETQNFVKEWITIQKDEWRKKLAAPGMNEAKEYDTIELFFERQDKQYSRRIDETLRSINNQVKNIARQKMRQEQRNQHPREKQRDRKKRRLLEELQRSFHQKEDYWLKRERDKERDYRKDKEREKEKEKEKKRRLEKQINMEPQEEERRAEKYQTLERRKLIEKEEQEDIEVVMEENPPLPQEMPDEKKKIAFVSEEFKLSGENRVQGDVLVNLPEQQAAEAKERELKKNQMFQDWEKIDQVAEIKPQVELHLPEIHNDEQARKAEEEVAEKIKELEKKVPQNKTDLWQFAINWDKLSKSTVLQRYIRPWLERKSDEYIGGVEEKFIALVEKKLLSRSHPDKIIKVLKQLLDDDSQEFVIKLWKKLILEYLKLESGLI